MCEERPSFPSSLQKSAVSFGLIKELLTGEKVCCYVIRIFDVFSIDSCCPVWLFPGLNFNQLLPAHSTDRPHGDVWEEWGYNIPNDCHCFIKFSCYCGDSILDELDKSWIPHITWSITCPTHMHGLGRVIFREVPKVMTAQSSLAQNFPKIWNYDHVAPRIPDKKEMEAKLRLWSHALLKVLSLHGLLLIWWGIPSLAYIIYALFATSVNVFVDLRLFDCLTCWGLRGRMAFLLATSCEACRRRATSHRTCKLNM